MPKDIAHLMGRNAYVPSAESRVASITETLRTCGIGEGLTLASQLIHGAKLETRVGQAGNGYAVNPTLRLIGDWHVTEKGILVPTETGEFPGSKNSRVTVVVEADAKTSDGYGGGTFRLGREIATKFDWQVSEDEMDESTPTIERKLAEKEIVLSGWQVMSDGAHTTEEVMRYIAASGIVPAKDLKDFVAQLASKGIYID